ncbi:MAG: hypothetical protein ACREBG_11440 [Pyrinomonadaceae bacterium]
MKRCPKCNFLYLDSDKICDLDQTPLVADDSNIEVGVPSDLNEEVKKASAGVATQQSKLNRRSVTMVTAAGLVIGLVLLISYQRLSRPVLHARQAPQTSQGSQESLQSSKDSPADVAGSQQESLPSSSDSSRNETESALVKPSLSTAGKPSPAVRTEPARLSLSSRPVSTGAAGKASRGPVTIRLTDGSSLQADEVWRTKAGIWYRRKGMVTLLKPNRVRSLE